MGPVKKPYTVIVTRHVTESVTINLHAARFSEASGIAINAAELGDNIQWQRDKKASKPYVEAIYDQAGDTVDVVS